ncbi:MAG: inositol monophosphatase family protein [Desulfurococcaceae archaeon]
MRKLAGDPMLRKTLANVVKTLRDALLDHYGKKEYAEVVGLNVTGDVTRKIDLIAEELLVKELKDAGLPAYVISEERGLYRIHEAPKYLVVADPLDGSLNYSLGIPLAAISIAVYEFERPRVFEPVYGIVASVFSNDVYEIMGREVYWNGRLVSRGSEGAGIFIVHTHSPELLTKLRRFANDRGLRPKFRVLGSLALETVYVAIGSAELLVYDTGGLRVNDIAVGVAMAKAMGLRIVMRPGPIEISVGPPRVIEELWIVPPYFQSAFPRGSQEG